MTKILQPSVREQLPQHVRQVQNIQRNAASLFQQVKSTWEQSVQTVWKGDTVKILETMGTDAVEFFRVSAATAAFLETLEPGATEAGRKLMRPFAEHGDGTITLDA